MRGESHPDNVDSDQHINGVIAGDAVEHAIGGVVASLPGHVLWKWHFVHAEGALGQGKHGSGDKFQQAQVGCHSKQPTVCTLLCGRAFTLW